MPEKETKTYTLEEIAEHSTSDSVWVLIDNGVYDVTKFLDEHPGGAEILLEVAGQEATDAFEDANHSSDARTLMEDYKIGELAEDDQNKATKVKTNETKGCCRFLPFLLPVGVALVALLVLRIYRSSSK